MKKSILLLSACAIVLAACTTPGQKTAIGTAGGAVVGAAAGAIITHNTGGKAEKGAIYGALAGAAAGGLAGNYLDKQAKELAAIAEVKKVKDANGQRLEVYLKNDILFNTGSSVLSPASTKTLNDLGRVLKKYPKNNIIVEGHTDSTGSRDVNKKLSTERAKAVYNALLGNGVKTLSLRYVGYGSDYPVASNNTAAGRAANRRVELKITANEKDLK